MNLITTLGFDVSHTLLIITKLGRPSRIVAIVARVDGAIDQRVETAFSMLKQFGNMVNVPIERVDIEVKDVEKSIETLLNILEVYTPAVLDIGGGLRLLVIETLLAYLMLDVEKRTTISLYTVIEGRNETLPINIDSVRRRVLLSRTQLDPLTQIVINIIKEYREPITPKEIIERLKEKEITVTKQKLSKILAKLAKQGVIERIERGKYRYKL